MIVTLFGNSKDYQILHEFIHRHWKEIYNKTGLDAYECLFYHEEWCTYPDRYNPIYNPDAYRKIATFSEVMIACLVQIGNLPKILQDELEQYEGEDWLETIKK